MAELQREILFANFRKQIRCVNQWWKRIGVLNRSTSACKEDNIFAAFLYIFKELLQLRANL